MKLTTGIVAMAIMAGTVWGQNPTVVANTKSALQAAQQKQTATQKTSPAAKPAAATPSSSTAKSVSPKPVLTAAPAKHAVPAKNVPAAKKAETVKAVGVKKAELPKAAPAAPEAKTADSDEAAPDKADDKKYSMTGRRDPFISPVVSRMTGSGCSTGKKCLEIEQIALRGVVRSDGGMIAVVTNGLNKAYFLRENDPVFNGYVVKITGDSVVFKETFQDKLGKPFTRDIVKKITTPAV